MATFLQRGKWSDRSRRCPHHVVLFNRRRANAIRAWAASDAVAGEFYISDLLPKGPPHYEARLKARFSDPDSAFACKMRWG